jgi:hypothetical protein
MKRSTKLALSLVLAVGAAMPAMAQDNFPDAPANHWAYDALAKMKADGLLVGYPDGLYRGARPASRYELAVAMHAVYSHLKSLIDGLQGQIDTLKGGPTQQDIQNLKDQIAHLQDEINAMKGWGDDIAALKRATEEFDKELRSLGVDVEAMKKDLGDLQDRVTRLEKKKLPVDVSGDINFFAVTTNSSKNGQFGIDQDGKLEGYSGGTTTGLGHDLTFLHEGAFHVASNNETGPKWQGTFVVGNMIGNGGFGSQSTFGRSPTGVGQYSYDEGPEDVYVQDLSIKTDIHVIGLSFNAEAGRVAYKLSPYVFQRPNTESYFDNERWNDGKYRFDGAILGFNFGPAKIHVWGGNTSNLLSVDGVDENPLVIANTRAINGLSEGITGTNGQTINPTANGLLGTIDQTAAADLSIGLGHNGHLGLDYLVLDQNGKSATGVDNLLDTGDANAGPSNRDQVFGGDADLGFGRFKVSGGYHKSDLTSNWTPSVSSHDNEAWNAKVSYAADRFNLWGGYREVDDNYYAPGDWGRLGVIQNPGNVKGWQAGAFLDLTRALRFTATGEWDKGVENTSGNAFDSSPFDSSTNIRQLMARLDLRINPNFSIYGSWQDATFSSLDPNYGGNVFAIGNGSNNAGVAGDNRANYDWTTIGLGYGLSSNTKFSLAYQFSNGGVVNPINSTGNARYNGGILTSQLTIKF